MNNVCDMTPGSPAILGEIPEVRGLYTSAGFSGTGFRILPAIGPLMRELSLDGGGKIPREPVRRQRADQGRLEHLAD